MPSTTEQKQTGRGFIYLSCFWMRRLSWAAAVLSRPSTRVSDDCMLWTRYSRWPNLLLR